MTAQTQTQSTQPNLLRRVLQANGVFSALSGIVLLVEAEPVASFLGFNASMVLIILGVVLVLYAADLFYMAAQEPINRHFALTAVVLDTAWVVGSAIILLTNWVPLTIGGKWAVLIVADIVAVFAALQFYALRQK